MKSNILIIVGMFAMLAAGFFIGKSYENRIWSRYADHDLYWWRATGDAERTVKILNCLQNGQRQEAINVLNVQLDVLVSGINNFTNFPEDFGIKAIHDAKIYRSKYPWESQNPEVNTIVDGILFPKNKK
jgi:hypothetical protein